MRIIFRFTFFALVQQEKEFIADRTKRALAAFKRDAAKGNAHAISKVGNRAQALTDGRADANRAMGSKVIEIRVSS